MAAEMAATAVVAVAAGPAAEAALAVVDVVALAAAVFALAGAVAVDQAQEDTHAGGPADSALVGTAADHFEMAVVEADHWLEQLKMLANAAAS